MALEWQRAPELMLVLLPFAVVMSVWLNRKAIDQPLKAFLRGIFFAAACVAAMALGLALGLAGWARYIDPGCGISPVGFHGCRVNEVRDFGLVWSAIVVASFLASVFIWRWRRKRSRRMLNRGSE